MFLLSMEIDILYCTTQCEILPKKYHRMKENDNPLIKSISKIKYCFMIFANLETLVVLCIRLYVYTLMHCLDFLQAFQSYQLVSEAKCAK